MKSHWQYLNWHERAKVKSSLFQAVVSEDRKLVPCKAGTLVSRRGAGKKAAGWVGQQSKQQNVCWSQSSCTLRVPALNVNWLYFLDQKESSCLRARAVWGTEWISCQHRGTNMSLSATWKPQSMWVALCWSLAGLILNGNIWPRIQIRCHSTALAFVVNSVSIVKRADVYTSTNPLDRGLMKYVNWNFH